jgi:ATP-dependent Clp protease ATP-binding subunit ClpA
MNSIVRPGLGFTRLEAERRNASGVADQALNEKVSRAGTEAARRKFAPEFMNRIDKTVVFRPLGSTELHGILDIELGMLQQRIFQSAAATSFVFSPTASARGFLLTEGTDMKYGARHLKRAIERNLVHPLSNLIASGQIRGGDLIEIDYDTDLNSLVFLKKAEDMPACDMVEMAAGPTRAVAAAASTGAEVETVRPAHARSQRSR